ncbi:hypothetical protein IMY05_016G0196900 [Salix suchowensis]|nr:hypothetical protein IMY05_016G0196900 [Salix suchowensis]
MFGSLPRATEVFGEVNLYSAGGVIQELLSGFHCKKIQCKQAYCTIARLIREGPVTIHYHAKRLPHHKSTAYCISF